MANTQATEQVDLDVKIREAEACHTMGMIRDALRVYEQILPDAEAQNSQIRETIQVKIEQLKISKNVYKEKAKTRRAY